MADFCRVQAYIRTTKLEEVLLALEDAGHLGVSVEAVRGYGRQQGQTETFRGSTYALNLVPKSRLELVCAADRAEDLVDVIRKAAYSNEFGDGKIFVSEVMDVVRIRTGERGHEALE